METNVTIFPELDEMRQQNALLKNLLEQEKIINDKLLRQTMNHKAQHINRKAWVSVGASLLVIACAPFYFRWMNFSWYFIAATILLMLVCDFFTWKYHKNLNAKTMNADLLTVAKTVKKLRTNYQDWLKYGIPMICVWILWCCVEIYRVNGYGAETISLIVATIIGSSIGGFIGWKTRNKIIKTCDEIISQIEDTTI